MSSIDHLIYITIKKHFFPPTSEFIHVDDFPVAVPDPIRFVIDGKRVVMRMDITNVKSFPAHFHHLIGPLFEVQTH